MREHWRQKVEKDLNCVAKICTHTFGDYILALVEKIFSTETHCYLTPEVEEDDYPTVLVTDEKTVTVDKTTTGDDTTAANTTTITKKIKSKLICSLLMTSYLKEKHTKMQWIISPCIDIRGHHRIRTISLNQRISKQEKACEKADLVPPPINFNAKYFKN